MGGSHLPNRNLCVAVSGPTMAEALATLASVEGRADLVELRLDLIEAFDLARLLAACPCPAIVTYRPRREGGAYAGPEDQRLRVLRRAADLGATWIDLELDVAERVGPFSPAKTIVSRHDFHSVPADLEALLHRLWSAGGDAVKLAAMARRPAECVALLRLLAAARGPSIVVGMGPAGVASRVLCLRSEACLLTYAAPDAGSGTAPGQVSLEQLERWYRARRIDARTAAIGYLGPAEDVDALEAANLELAQRGLNAVCVPLGPVGVAEGLEAIVGLELRGAIAPSRLESELAAALPAHPAAPGNRARANVVLAEQGRLFADWALEPAAQIERLAPLLA